MKRKQTPDVSLSLHFAAFTPCSKLFTTSTGRGTSSPQILFSVCCLQLSRFQMLQRKLPPPAYSTPGPSSTPFPLPPKHPLFPRIKQVIVVRRNSSDLFASQHIQILPVELGLVTNPCCIFEMTNMLETKSAF